jgi:hypothetical protein
VKAAGTGRRRTSSVSLTDDQRDRIRKIAERQGRVLTDAFFTQLERRATDALREDRAACTPRETAETFSDLAGRTRQVSKLIAQATGNRDVADAMRFTVRNALREARWLPSGAAVEATTGKQLARFLGSLADELEVAAEQDWAPRVRPGPGARLPALSRALAGCYASGFGREPGLPGGSSKPGPLAEMIAVVLEAAGENVGSAVSMARQGVGHRRKFALRLRDGDPAFRATPASRTAGFGLGRVAPEWLSKPPRRR